MILGVPFAAIEASLRTHGIGGRTDLPLPTWLATTGAVLAVLISFAAITARWPGPRQPDEAGWPLPAGLRRVVDNAWARNILRAMTLVFVVFVVVVAFAGPPTEGLNIAPYSFYITFWIGLIPASLLLGPIWRIVNPLRTIHRGIERLIRMAPGTEPVPIPTRLGWWPAAAWLSSFVWLELVFPDRSLPSTVGSYIVVYAVVNLAAAQFFGSAWFDRGDGFEAYSTVIATVSPLGRRADGRLVVRNPVDGALRLRDEPGLLAVVVALIGSTAFDGLTRTRYWLEQVDGNSIPVGTAGLFGSMLAVLGLYLAAMKISQRLIEPRSRIGMSEDRQHAASSRLPGLFAVSLIPIAVAYSVAHYASLFFYEGQGTLILLSDPFNTGASYLGTRRDNVDYTVISVTAVAFIQIGAIVLGHILAVIVAHFRAVALFDKPTAKRTQYPLMVVMLFLTGMAVTLLINT